MMANGMPELGSKISLISKADIRYEGRLFTVDPHECTIALATVRSFGTEDRETQFPVAPQNQVYDYILFRGSDIKDIRVVNNVNSMPNDPAIMQLSAPPSLQQQAYQPQGFAHPVLGAAMGPPMGQFHGAPYGHLGGLPTSMATVMGQRPPPIKQTSELSRDESRPHAHSDSGVRDSPHELLAGSVSRSNTPLTLHNLARKSPTMDQGVQVTPMNNHQATGGIKRAGPQHQGQQAPPHQQMPPPQQAPHQQMQHQGPPPARGSQQVLHNQQGYSGQQRVGVGEQRERRESRGERSSEAQSSHEQAQPPAAQNKPNVPVQRVMQSQQQQQQQPGPQGAHPAQQGAHGGGLPSQQGFQQQNQRPGQGGWQGRPNMRQRGRGRNLQPGVFRQPQGVPPQGNQKPKNTLKFENDYDFEQANTEFEELRSQLAKVKLVEEPKAVAEGCIPSQQVVNGVEVDKKDDSGNETGAGENEPEEEEICYDKTKSFFDNISCEAVERSKGRSQRTDWRTERKLNSETFGVASARRGGYRGRGGYYNRGMGGGMYNRGGFRGGFRGNFRGGRGGPGQPQGIQQPPRAQPIAAAAGDSDSF